MMIKKMNTRLSCVTNTSMKVTLTGEFVQTTFIICGPAMPLELRQFAVQFRLFLARLMCEKQSCRLIRD